MISARHEELIFQALERLERDLRATEHDITLTWKPYAPTEGAVASSAYPGIWVLIAEARGSTGGFLLSTRPDEPDFLVEIADQFQELMAQDIGPWPKCPICGRPLQPVLDDGSWWICDRDANIRVPIGELNGLETKNE